VALLAVVIAIALTYAISYAIGGRFRGIFLVYLVALLVAAWNGYGPGIVSFIVVVFFVFGGLLMERVGVRISLHFRAFRNFG